MTKQKFDMVSQPAPVVPEGYVLVPIKPTIEMVEAGYEASLGMPDRSGHARAIEMFDAMLAAAPAQGQQVGQEPQRCQCCGYLVTESEHRGCLRAAAPQPAPAQDVAGWIPVTERLPEVETDVLVRGVRRNEVMHRVAGLFNGEWSSQETEDLLLGEVTHWMPLPAAPAHDKQSGEKKS